MSQRSITVKKTELISKIKENKTNHIQEYDKAVIAFKERVTRQLEESRLALESGDYSKVNFRLTVPENKSDEYDKLVKMFEWEIKEEVELSQAEFNEYVLDETPFALQAKISNSAYLG